jgi:hypothetical protein
LRRSPAPDVANRAQSRRRRPPPPASLSQRSVSTPRTSLPIRDWALSPPFPPPEDAGRCHPRPRPPTRPERPETPPSFHRATPSERCSRPGCG